MIWNDITVEPWDAMAHGVVDENTSDAPGEVGLLLTGASGSKDVRMKVFLFGGLRVYIDGEPIPDSAWRKSKAKLLFAHLVTRFGREVGRDVLLTSLWPGMDHKHALDNFYVTWSIVRRAVGSGDGEISFVRGNRTLYSIDPTLVASDVHEFDLLARQALFGKLSKEELVRVFVRMDQLYTGDILAGLKCDSHLTMLRERYKDTYVDALISGAKALLEQGNAPGALWFARRAFCMNSTREDVYQTLMHTQALAGQRTAAMETFFLCKDYLDSELGVSVSRKTIDIYERLLSEDF